MHYAVRATIALVLVSIAGVSFAADNSAKSFTLQDFRGKAWSLDELKDQKVIVLASHEKRSFQMPLDLDLERQASLALGGFFARRLFHGIRKRIGHRPT